MIEPATDYTGRLLWVSLVPPLSDAEKAALTEAMRSWNTWNGKPIVWTHGDAELPTIQLNSVRGRVEPEIEDEP